MGIDILPKSSAGRTSVWLFIAGICFILLLAFLISSGQRGGQTFFSNPLLAISFIAADFSLIAGLFAGLLGVVRHKERSIIVIVVMMIGIFAVYFTAGELFGPH